MAHYLLRCFPNFLFSELIVVQKENQRVAISKRLLKEGVMKLLEKKHIDDISISELCELSGINRTTFYRHYQTPYDVLLEIELDFAKNFCNIPQPLKEVEDFKEYITQISDVFYENRDTVRLFIQNCTDSDIALIFQNLVNSFTASRKILYKGRSINAEAFKLMQTFFAYGAYAMVRQWISEDVPLTADEIADLAVNLSNRDFSFE